MADPYIGEIRIFPYTYAPEGWLECNGQLLQSQQYQALYAVISNQYGGTTPATFALPNLTGNAPIGMGQGMGLSAYTLGEQVGGAAVTLEPNQLPAHTHPFAATLVDDTTPTQSLELANPAGAKLSYLFTRPNVTTHYELVDGYSDSANTTMAPQSLTSAGQTGAHANQQPYLAFRFCIAWTGIYPTKP